MGTIQLDRISHLTLAEWGNGWALYNWSESPYLGGAGEWVGTIQLDRITLPWRSEGMGGHYTIGQNHLTLAQRGNGWALYNWTESAALPWRSVGMGGHYTIGQNQSPYLGILEWWAQNNCIIKYGRTKQHAERGWNLTNAHIQCKE